MFQSVFLTWAKSYFLRKKTEDQAFVMHFFSIEQLQIKEASIFLHPPIKKNKNSCVSETIKNRLCRTARLQIQLVQP